MTDSPPESSPVTYGSYLRLDELLELQSPRSQEHDELLFIVIHQVYELWFKQLLHELRRLRDRLMQGDTPQALATLKRVLTILKTLVGQVDILETMTPLSFNAFRDRLATSSGFQSAQFRAVEFLLGHKRRGVLAAYPPETREHRLLSDALEEPSIADALRAYLKEIGVLKDADPLNAGSTGSESVLESALLEVYRHHPFPAQVCERLVDLDEGLQEWRYRHVKMVERTIGTKPGTGGSPGSAYLRETLFKPLFPALWAIRAQL